MTTQLKITGTLKAKTAIHIGTGTGNNVTDALIRRNGAGQPIIPGTAIAGAMRAMLTRLAPSLGLQVCHARSDEKNKRERQTCTCPVCHLFGSLNPTDPEDLSNEDAQPATASRLFVYDAPLQTPRRTTIRDGVGLNRTTRTASDAAKFDLEVLPIGSAFHLQVELRPLHAGSELAETDKQLLAVALSEWSQERVWLGGRVSRGLGHFALTNLDYAELDLDQADQLMDYLLDNDWRRSETADNWIQGQLKVVRQTLQAEVQADDEPMTTPNHWLKAAFTLSGTGPLLVHDTVSAAMSGFDHAPLMLDFAQWEKPILSGSSLRGVIRAHAERLARTLATMNATGDKADFLRKCPACDPLVARPKKEAVALESCDSLLKQLPLTEKQKIAEQGDVAENQLCLACHLFGSPRRGSRFRVADAPMTGDLVYKMLDFLAVDRFTGGGADGAKFDALTLWRPQFQVALFLEEPQPWELGWLALTLRDLATGWLRVGLGAAKGFGQVQVDLATASLTLGFMGNTPLGLDTLSPTQPSETIYNEVVYNPTDQAIWRAQAEGWITAFHQKIKNTETTRPATLPDTYFGRVDHLYQEVQL